MRQTAEHYKIWIVTYGNTIVYVCIILRTSCRCLNRSVWRYVDWSRKSWCLQFPWDLWFSLVEVRWVIRVGILWFCSNSLLLISSIVWVIWAFIDLIALFSIEFTGSSRTMISSTLLATTKFCLYVPRNLWFTLGEIRRVIRVGIHCFCFCCKYYIANPRLSLHQFYVVLHCWYHQLFGCFAH